VSEAGWLKVEYHKVRRFAWWPQRVSNGRWVFLRHFWIKVPAYRDS
jgi:hypothetical protein